MSDAFSDIYTDEYLDTYGYSEGAGPDDWYVGVYVGVPTPAVIVEGVLDATITAEPVAVNVSVPLTNSTLLQLPIPGTLPELPIQTVRWDFYQMDQRSTARGQRLTRAMSKRITFSLIDPCTASFTMDGNDPDAAILDELVDDIGVYRNGKLMHRGRLVGSSDSIDQTKHTVNMSAIDYKGLLYRRSLAATIDTLTAAREQTHIAWEMLSGAQGVIGGDMGITEGRLPATGVLRGDTWERGTYVGEALDELAAREYGFEWSIDEQLKFNVHYPARGQVRQFAAVYGGNVQKVNRTVDPSEYGNAVFSTSSDSTGATIIVLSELENLGSAPQGRWDKLDSSTATTTTELAQKSRGVLAASSALTPSYVLDMMTGTWTPEDCWLGDSIKVVVHRGRLHVDDYYRIQNIEISTKDDGTEDVKLTVGQPLMSTVNRLWHYSRRITELERR